ncbi:MAG: hypothetical protein IPK07_07840 [Deltaproteobacteria bacterium]|nr:hypothetical protein [Deltaproteobacteria bacterium]
MPRFGVEYEMPVASEWPVLDLLQRIDWRVGYYYELRRTRRSTASRTSSTATSTSHRAGGLNFAPIAEEARLRVDLYGQFHQLVDRFTMNEGDLRRGPYTAGGSVFALGLEVRGGLVSRRRIGRRGVRRARWIALACVAMAGTARAQTGSTSMSTVATRSAAMGQAFTGLADTAAAAYYNPGGVGFAPAQTSLGFRYTNPELRIEFRGEPRRTSRPMHLPPRAWSSASSPDLDHPGLNKRFPWLEPLALGVEVFLPLPQVNSFSTFTSTAQAYFFRYDTRPDVLSLVFSLAYRITDWLSIGGGFMPNFDSPPGQPRQRAPQRARGRPHHGHRPRARAGRPRVPSRRCSASSSKRRTRAARRDLARPPIAGG